MSGNEGFGTEPPARTRKVRIERDGTTRASVGATGHEGISHRRRDASPVPALLHRLKVRIART